MGRSVKDKTKIYYYMLDIIREERGWVNVKDSSGGHGFLFQVRGNMTQVSENSGPVTDGETKVERLGIGHTM